MKEREPTARRPPDFSAQRLLLIGSGAITAMHLPFWIKWLTNSYPTLEVQVLLTHSAERFVSAHALTALTRRPVLRDEWRPDLEPEALHVRLAEWSEAAAVYPACLNYISRLATGMADTPSLLTLQCTSAPIVVAPSLPPGAEQNPIYTGHLHSLSRRTNVAVTPTQPAVSVTTGRPDAAGAPPLWVVISALERILHPPAGVAVAPAEADRPLGESCSN